MATLNRIIKDVTTKFVNLLNPNNPPPPPDIEQDLLEDARNEILLENATRPKGNLLSPPCKLNASQISDIMLKIHHIVRINCAGPNSDESCDILAIYLPEEGIYTSDEDVFKLLALEYNYSATPKELKDIVEKNHCGIFTKSGDKEAFKESILTLYRDRELCKEYGRNGRKFVMENLTREIGTQKYVDVIKSVCNN